MNWSIKLYVCKTLGWKNYDRNDHKKVIGHSGKIFNVEMIKYRIFTRTNCTKHQLLFTSFYFSILNIVSLKYTRSFNILSKLCRYICDFRWTLVRHPKFSVLYYRIIKSVYSSWTTEKQLLCVCSYVYVLFSLLTARCHAKTFRSSALLHRSAFSQSSRLPLPSIVVKRQHQTVLPDVSDDGACHKYIVRAHWYYTGRLVITVLPSRVSLLARGKFSI